MIKELKFLYELIAGLNNEERQKTMLKSIILTEAKFNNDIVNVIHTTGANNVANKSPDLYKQLQTKSQDLLLALGFTAKDIFKDNLTVKPYEIERKMNTLGYFKNLSDSDLYDFYIRKIDLLKSLAESNAIASVSVKLATRIHNIRFATMLIGEDR